MFQQLIKNNAAKSLAKPHSPLLYEWYTDLITYTMVILSGIDALPALSRADCQARTLI